VEIINYTDFDVEVAEATDQLFTKPLS